MGVGELVVGEVGQGDSRETDGESRVARGSGRRMRRDGEVRGEGSASGSSCGFAGCGD